ncbi:hypothetical protein LJB86_02925 [Deltaproteobacteria bacterium OttesenSCG-928-M10]|nr:hypothetical protein [Deltaproteobacteria bacterium OttesenSCG-928-M10]
MNENSSRQKQMAVIAGLVIFLSLAAWLLFYYGRQHRVIIDNRSVELEDGQSFRSLDGALVAIDHPALDREAVLPGGLPPDKRPVLSFKFWPGPDDSIVRAVELMPRERIMVKVVGPGFNLKAEVYDKMGDSVGTIDTDIHLGARRNAMVRLVKLHRNLPDVLEEYPNQAVRQPSAEEPVPAGGSEGLIIGDEPIP